MKKSIIIASIMAVLCGCQTHASLLTPQTAPQQVVQTNTVTTTNVVVQTNTVTQTLTNGVTVTNQVFTTNVQIQTIPVTVTNTVNVTNGYVVSSGVSNILGTLQATNSLTAPVDPYSPFVTLALTGLSAGLAYYAKVKTKQAQTHASAATTIITAIEGLGPAASAGIKSAVAAKSAQMGTSAAVNQVVGAVTANL